MESIEYSIIVPVYNSQSSLEELVSRIAAVMAPYRAELILVDDGSADDSWAWIRKLAGEPGSLKIRGIRLSRNFGQQNATLCGLRAATGRFAVTIDDDLQVPPEEIRVLIGHMAKGANDVVYGVYQDQQQSRLRNLMRAVRYKVMSVFGHKGIDYSSFRMINGKTRDRLVGHNAFFVNIDEVIAWYTRYISCVPVQHLPRPSGASNYSIFSLVLMSLKVLFGYYSLPLKFIVGLGFYVALASFLLGVMFVVKKVFFGVDVEGWTSLMVSLLFSTGIITFSLGMVGKYLLHIITLQHGKPGYAISEQTDL